MKYASCSAPRTAARVVGFTPRPGDRRARAWPRLPRTGPAREDRLGELGVPAPVPAKRASTRRRCRATQAPPAERESSRDVSSSCRVTPQLQPTLVGTVGDLAPFRRPRASRQIEHVLDHVVWVVRSSSNQIALPARRRSMPPGASSTMSLSPQPPSMSGVRGITVCLLWSDTSIRNMPIPSVNATPSRSTSLTSYAVGLTSSLVSSAALSKASTGVPMVVAASAARASAGASESFWEAALRNWPGCDAEAVSSETAPCDAGRDPTHVRGLVAARCFRCVPGRRSIARSPREVSRPPTRPLPPSHCGARHARSRGESTRARRPPPGRRAPRRSSIAVDGIRR